MFSGPPLPLRQDFTLAQLLACLPSRRNAGAWLGQYPRQVRVYLRRAGLSVLLSGDLGVLLRQCDEIVVREGPRAVVVPASELIRWRVLRIVTGMPYLPGPAQLKEIFPGAVLEPAGFSVPVQGVAPEAVLAQCITNRIPVLGSRIMYSHPQRQPAPFSPLLNPGSG
jgi:hypothetical protein